MSSVPKSVTHTIPQFRDWIRSRRCLVTGRHGVEACHVRTRRNNGDVANLIPLCPGAHREQHQIGVVSFAAKYDLRMEMEAKRLWYEWLRTEAGRHWQEETECG